MKDRIRKIAIGTGNFCIRHRAFFSRLLLSLITLMLAIGFGFLCVKMMPGDVVEMYARNLSNARKIPYEDAYRLAVQLLDYDPQSSIFAQLWNYVRGIFHGNFGTSMYRDDVTTIGVIRDFMPWTLLVSGVALLLSFVLGVLLGGRMAAKRKGIGHIAANSYIVVSGAIPDYLFGMLLLIVFSVKLRIFPEGGNYDLMMELDGVPKIVNVMYHAALPILAYTFVQTGVWALNMRGSALGVLGEDYIYAARVRGIPERRIRGGYLRRNAMLPLVTGFAISFGAIFGGSPLMEFIFNYPGFGAQFNNFVGQRDYFIIQGMMVFMSFMIIFANFIADSVYTLIDPRIRREA